MKEKKTSIFRVPSLVKNTLKLAQKANSSTAHKDKSIEIL